MFEKTLSNPEPSWRANVGGRDGAAKMKTETDCCQDRSTLKCWTWSVIAVEKCLSWIRGSM
eukprot:1751076-Amphidinium_carterae.1